MPGKGWSGAPISLAANGSPRSPARSSNRSSATSPAAPRPRWRPTSSAAATAIEVDGERVVLEVTDWFAGTDDQTAAQTVELTAPAGLEALTGGIAFEVGEPYLVSATDGVVDYCGLSGPATTELQSLSDDAFGA